MLTWLARVVIWIHRDLAQGNGCAARSEDPQRIAAALPGKLRSGSGDPVRSPPEAMPCCAQKCAQLSFPRRGRRHDDRVNRRQFIARARRWARPRNLKVRFVASQGSGSHGTLHVGARRTTVKDRKKGIGKGLLARMPADLGIDRNDFQ